MGQIRYTISMESSRAELQEKIKAQGDIVRKLKAEKAEKSLIGEEVEKLKALKLQLDDDNASSGHGAELQEKIKTQGDIVRKLKAEKAEKNLIDEQVEILKALKLQQSDDNAASSGKLVLKTAKGTRDFQPEQMAVREYVLKKIVKVFKVHGAVTIDTPVFE